MARRWHRAMGGALSVAWAGRREGGGSVGRCLGVFVGVMLRAEYGGGLHCVEAS